MGNKNNLHDGYHSMQELYDYRLAYNACLFNEWSSQGKYNVVKSFRHDDGELCFGGSHFVVYALTPFGQVTNHYKVKHWDLFDVEEVPLAPEFDGHNPEVALQRLLSTARIGK